MDVLPGGDRFQGPIAPSIAPRANLCAILLSV